MRLEGKVLIITGTSGIAAATARLAVEEGARVFLVGRTPEKGESLRQELGDGCGFHTADLAQPDSSSETVRRCLAQFGRLDALYNVAGISGRRYGDGPLHECSEEGWDVTFDNNVKSLFLMSRAVLGHLLQQSIGESGQRGNILHMSSVLASRPESKMFAAHAYTAGKGAIVALTRAMASYYATYKIRVNAIAPGLVRTPMSRRAQEDPSILEFIKAKQPLTGGMLEAEDVARASVFLMSDEARGVTGEVFTVDGGWSVSGP